MEGINQNIESWLLGEMDETERAAFESELKSSPDLQAEVERQSHLLATLQSLALRKKVVEAIGFENLGKTEDEIFYPKIENAAAAPPKNRSGNWWKVLLLLMTGGALGIGYQYFTASQKVPAPIENTPAQPSGTQKEVQKIAETETPNGPEKSPKKQIPNTPPPVRRPLVFEILEKDFDKKYRAAVRLLKNGQLADASADLSKLEKSIFPEDEVRAMDEEQEAQMDTLNFLQGLGALQSGQFGAAVSHFSTLDFPKKPFREEAQFYLLQSFLFKNEAKNARSMFEKIRADKKHRFLGAAKTVFD